MNTPRQHIASSPQTVKTVLAASIITACSLFIAYSTNAMEHRSLQQVSPAALPTYTTTTTSPANAATTNKDQLSAGVLMFPGSDQQQQPGIQLASEAHIQINAMVARITLKQSFRNPTDQWSEAIYQFPLPEQSAVDQLKIRIGERLIIGEIQEKAKARATYAKARAAGKATGLVEQQRPNLFTSKVANIPPGKTIDIEISYLQEISYQKGSYSMIFPMTLTPRYIPGLPLPVKPPKESQPGWANNTDQVPDASEITPPQQFDAGFSNRIQLSLSVDAGLPLANLHSTSHPLQITREQRLYQVQPAAGLVPMDRDFHLSWTPASGNAPTATVLIEAKSTSANETSLHKGEGKAATDPISSSTIPSNNAQESPEQTDSYYSMLTLLPPESTDQQAPLSREQIYIIDTSGSMSGASIEQAKAALKQAISQLGPDDYFNIIEFNSQTQALFSAPRRTSMFSIAEALQFISRLNANGGTEIAPALQTAFSQTRSSADTSQVIFITDGSIGNEVQLLQQIERQRGERRLFTIAIGSAPNRFFMRKAAQFGQGSYTHINQPDMVKQRIEDLFDKLKKPLLSNIIIQWPESADQCPESAADLFASEPLILYCRLSNLDGQVIIQGQQGSEHWTQQLPLKSLQRGARDISKLWARNKIERLEDEQLGTLQDDALKKRILQLALDHQLVSRYTSLIAVDRTPIRPDMASLDSERIANLMPAGSKMSAFPKTATPSLLLVSGGGFLLLFGLAGLWQSTRSKRCLAGNSAKQNRHQESGCVA